MRAERRRQIREQEAHTTNDILSEDRTAGDWDKLRPDLDQVLSELDEADRDALVLRFFDDRPFVDVGAKLNLGSRSTEVSLTLYLELRVPDLAPILVRKSPCKFFGALWLMSMRSIPRSNPKNVLVGLRSG